MLIVVILITLLIGFIWGFGSSQVYSSLLKSFKHDVRRQYMRWAFFNSIFWPLLLIIIGFAIIGEWIKKKLK